MSYYAGDHWHRMRFRGPYRVSGDPGLFSFIKRAARVVTSVAKSPLLSAVSPFVPGLGVVSSLGRYAGIARAVGGLLGGAGHRAPPEAGEAAPPQPVGTPGLMAAHAGGRLRYRRARSRRRRRY